VYQISLFHKSQKYVAKLKELFYQCE